MIIYVDSYASDSELEYIANAVSEKYGTEFRVFRRYYSKGIEQIGASDVALRSEYEQTAQAAACEFEYDEKLKAKLATMGDMPYGC